MYWTVSLRERRIQPGRPLRPPAMIAPTRRAAYAALVVTAALWGSHAVVARDLLDTLAPLWISALRWVVVLLLLGPFVWRDRAAIGHALRHDWRGLTLFALLGFAPQQTVIYGGLAGTTAINFGVLNSAIPVLIVMIAAYRHHRRPQPTELAGLALSLTGVLVLVVHGDLRALARLAINPSDLVLLVGMFIWAVYTVKLADRPPALPFPAFVFAAGAIGVLLLLPAIAWQLAAHGLPALRASDLAGLLYIGALPSLVATLLFGYGLAKVGPIQAGVFTHLVPVFAALLAVLTLGERLHPYHAAGFALVAGGALLCCLRREPVLSSPPGDSCASRGG
jgi:drug/metabolite transporter (DMT)-like permease